MHQRIQKAKVHADDALRQYNNAVAVTQLACTHEHLEECEYQPSKYLASLPPMRVCVDCGLTEEGWGPGYIVLKGRAGIFPRTEIYAKRCGFFVSDKHKGPLIRKEVTIDQLITKGLS